MLNLVDMKGRLTEIAPLMPLAVGLMTGIVVGRYVALPVSWWYLLIGGVVLALLSWRMPHVQTVAIELCFVLLGASMAERQHWEQDFHTTKGEVYSEETSRLERSKLFFLQKRDQLLQRLSDGGMEGDAYAVVAAMALGDKSALTKDLKDTYSVTGASHVLALSGLHLGIIYMLLSLVVGRRWRMVSQLLVILSIWAFVFLVGMSVSVVRSAIMLSVYALLSLGHRRRMSVNTLAFTAMIMLVVNPKSLFDVGFQMSFMAVLSILLWMPIFGRMFTEQYLMDHRVVKWLWGLLSVSCAAQMGVAPLVAFYFGRFSSYFLLTNLIVIPAATLILYLALVVLVAPSLAYLLIYIVNGLNVVLARMAELPGASIDGLHPTMLQVIMVYVIIFSFWLIIERTLPAREWKPSRVRW